MQPERWQQIDELLDAALEQPVARREEFLQAACADDEDLRREVASLLKAYGKAESFIAAPAVEMAAQALAQENTRVLETLIGRALGPYVVEKLLGAGGMGEVYLARDEKLKRKVALKILPPQFVADESRVRRFTREAYAVSALNHPNLLTIYDIGQADGAPYLATEFVEGKTLRELAGQLSLAETLSVVTQIAEALSAAHAAGVTHRDIKPENIMVRPDGYVKVLDFGLAKLSEEAADADSRLSATRPGLVMGTLAYMSPEQASGEPADPRSDIWSLGVVLYELATGRQPFKGANRQATLNAILTQDPQPVTASNPELRQELDHIIGKALEKDRELRYQTASDLRADLKRLRRETESSPASHGLATKPIQATIYQRQYLLYALAGLVLVGCGVWFFVLRRTSFAAADWSQATNIQLTEQVGIEFFPNLAPDGKSFVYAADTNGNFDIFVQRVGGKNATNLTKDSTATDTQPAFSPDGESIAFRSEREPKGVYVMGASGENLRRVADFGFHPSWSPEGKELVISTFGGDQPTVRSGSDNKLWITNVETGAKRELLKAEASFPAWSPTGKRVAYWFYTAAFAKRDIATIPADGGEPVIVTKDFAVSNWNPVWSPDGKFLYFVSNKNGSLNFWRVRIDEASGAVLSEPEPVVTPSKFSRHLNFSRDGKRMIYVQTNNQANIQGAEFNAKAEKIVGAPFWITQGDREITRAELSADGTRFVMRAIRRTQDDIVTVSRDGREWRDITNDAPFDRYVRWSPDGKQMAFSSDRNAGGEIWMCNADGTNLRQITFQYTENSSSGFPLWSPDGKRLIYTNSEGQVFILDLSKTWQEQTPQKVPHSDNVSQFVAWDWSPDGKKLAGTITAGNIKYLGFYSFATNRYEKLVEANDSLSAWLPDSRRVVYSSDNKVFMTDIETRASRELVSVPATGLRSPFVSRDGQLLYYTAHTSESDIWLLDNSRE